MLVGFIACRCAMNLTRLKSDDYTCRTVRKWLVDAGSSPASSTNTLKANPNRLAFFCLLPRVCAGSCGFLRTAERAISAGGVSVDLVPEHSTSKSGLLLLSLGGHDCPQLERIVWGRSGTEQIACTSIFASSVTSR